MKKILLGMLLLVVMAYAALPGAEGNNGGQGGLPQNWVEFQSFEVDEKGNSVPVKKLKFYYAGPTSKVQHDMILYRSDKVDMKKAEDGVPLVVQGKEHYLDVTLQTDTGYEKDYDLKLSSIVKNGNGFLDEFEVSKAQIIFPDGKVLDYKDNLFEGRNLAGSTIKGGLPAGKTVVRIVFQKALK